MNCFELLSFVVFLLLCAELEPSLINRLNLSLEFLNGFR